MSLIGTLQVSKTSLMATQAAIQTVGNNIANANDANYTRQVVRMDAADPRKLGQGIFLGTGVDVGGVARQVDSALLQRMRGSISDAAAADAALTLYEQVEAVFNELTDDDLSTTFSEFFNTWSNLANRPSDVSLRQVVVNEGRALARRLGDMDRRLAELSADTASRRHAFTLRADDLASQIADLNASLVKSEAGRPETAHTLRDRRDGLMAELATLLNVHAIEEPSGALTVYVNSEPLVIGSTSRGLTIDDAGRVRLRQGGAAADARGGGIAGLDAATAKIAHTRDSLDRLTKGLVGEFNRLHASGFGLIGNAAVTGAYAATDPAAPLTSGTLPFPVTGGSFVVHVRDADGPGITPHRVTVEPGVTSLDGLAAALGAIPGVSASVAGGRLAVSADAARQTLSFTDDTSGVLAAAGIGVFFTGTTARDLGVSEALSDARRLVASADATDNGNAVARRIAALQDTPLAGLGGTTLTQAYEAIVFDVASTSSSARTESQAADAVRDTLRAQREALSGVSLDEEAVSLLRYQRSYQASARMLAAVDEMMKTILQLV